MSDTKRARYTLEFKMEAVRWVFWDTVTGDSGGS